jgi:hypothetical protein
MVLWKVQGDGNYFSTFYVEAEHITEAMARATDILAGADNETPGRGKRFYGTVETHIVSIAKMPHNYLGSGT